MIAIAIVLGLLAEQTLGYSKNLRTGRPDSDIPGYLPPVPKDRVDPELFKRNRERTRSAVMKVRAPVDNRNRPNQYNRG